MNDQLTETTSFKTRIRVNNKQETALLRWCRARKLAFNYALNLCKIYLEECDRLGEKNELLSRIPVFDKYFNATKYPLCFERKQKGGLLIGCGGNNWIRDTQVPSSACQLAIKFDLKEAWKKYYRGEAKQPHFQSKFRRSSVTLSSVDIKPEFIHRDYIELPKGLGKLQLGDPIPYTNYSSGNVTFSKHGKHWYVSFTLHVAATEYYKIKSARNDVVGIDLGVNVYAATSEGINYYAPEKLVMLERRKSRINQKAGKIVHKNLMLVVKICDRCCSLVSGVHEKKYLCRICRDEFKKRLNSRQLKKLRASIASISAKQQRIRENMGHQLTTELVKGNNTIVIEDLKVKNMTASASGTSDCPGSNVKQKAGLNRSLLNIAPYRVRSMLEYKSKKFGRNLVLVDPKYTSQQCQSCGYTASENRKGAVFICQNCGYEAHADTNAAKNIKDKSLKNDV